jgi:hypothetical protein
MARLERLLMTPRGEATASAAAGAGLPHSLQAAWSDLNQHTATSLRTAQAEPTAGLGPVLQVQQATHQAQRALWEAAVAQHKRSISQRIMQVQRQQLALGLAMALLGSAGLALAAGLLRRLGTRPAPPAPPKVSAGQAGAASQSGSQDRMGTAPGSKQAEAARLFSRLRSANDEAHAPQARSSHPEPEDTLPPGKA